MTSKNETDNFYDWLMHSDAEDARKAFSDCQCGFDATYRDRKDAKDYLKQYHMHSWWCPSYNEKPKDETDGK